MSFHPTKITGVYWSRHRGRTTHFCSMCNEAIPAGRQFFELRYSYRGRPMDHCKACAEANGCNTDAEFSVAPASDAKPLRFRCRDCKQILSIEERCPVSALCKDCSDHRACVNAGIKTANNIRTNLART